MSHTLLLRLLKKYHLDPDEAGIILSIAHRASNIEDFKHDMTEEFMLDDMEDFGITTSWEEFYDDLKDCTSEYYNDDHQKLDESESIDSYKAGDLDIKENPSKVIVTQHYSDLKPGQVIDVIDTTKTHYIYKKGRVEMGVPKEATSPLLSEGNIKRGISTSDKKITQQYIKYTQKGYTHDKVCKAIAESINVPIAEVEAILEESINIRVIPSQVKKQRIATPKRRRFISESYEYEDPNTEEEIADDVFMELIKGSQYRKGYDTLEDAVVAVINILNLQDVLGNEGVLNVTNIIKRKYVDEYRDDDIEDDYGEYDYNDVDEYSAVEYDMLENSSEVEVGGTVSESVKKHFGHPLRWEKTQNHYIARFYDKPLVESKLSAIRREVSTYEKSREDGEYTFLYFKR